MNDKASSFVPELVKHVLVYGGKIEPPYDLQFQSVGLFADVSGFTAMTEKLCVKGSLGSEELADKMRWKVDAYSYDRYTLHAPSFPRIFCREISLLAFGLEEILRENFSLLSKRNLYLNVSFCLVLIPRLTCYYKHILDI